MMNNGNTATADTAKEHTMTEHQINSLHTYAADRIRDLSYREPTDRAVAELSDDISRAITAIRGTDEVLAGMLTDDFATALNQANGILQ